MAVDGVAYTRTLVNVSTRVICHVLINAQHSVEMRVIKDVHKSVTQAVKAVAIQVVI